MNLPRGSFVFLVLILVFGSSAAFGQFQFGRIVVTGVPTDVTVFDGSQASTQSMTFESLSDNIIDLYGDVAIGGVIQSPNGPEEGIWFHRRSSSTFELHVKENQPALGPGDGTRPNAVYGAADGQRTFGPLKLSTQSGYTYRARLKGGDTTADDDTAVYRHGALVVREGDLFHSQESPRVGDLFEFAGLAQETIRRPLPVRNSGPAADTAVQMPPFNSNFPREGVEVGGFGTQRFLGDLRDVRPLLVPRSLDVVFRGSVTGAGITDANDERIFLKPFGGTRPIELASEGESPAGEPSLQLDSFYHPVTGFDRIYYAARLSGPAVSGSNDSAIVHQRPLLASDHAVLLREGHPIAGATPGALLGDLGSDNIVGGGVFNLLFNNQLLGPGISEGNDWALIVTSVDRAGMFSARALAQEGSHVQGLPANSVLAGLDAPHFQFNLMDEVIFNAQFVGPGASGDALLYANINEPQPRLIVRTGQDFDIGGGVIKAIADIGLIETANSWDGRASQLNDAGQVVFNLTFTDGSQGIFTTAVPEPGTIVLASAAGMVILGVGLRRLRPGAA